MSDKVIQRDEQARRLQAARLAAGYAKPINALSKNATWKQSTYLAHENGQNGLTIEAARRYAAAFGVDAGWLLTGEGKGPVSTISGSSLTNQPHEFPSKYVANGPNGTQYDNNENVPATNPPDIDISSWSRDLPVYGSGSCGEDGVFEFNGQKVDAVRRPPRLKSVPDAYALYVDGSSMSPWREHGGLVIVHPHLPVLVMDYVVVQMRPQSPGQAPPAYIKRLIRRTAKDLVLFQWQPLPGKEIRLKAADVLSIHKIVDLQDLIGL